MANESTAWYQSFIVWLGIALTLLILAACIHLIIISTGTDTGPKGKTTNGITHVLGMPLTHEPTANHEEVEPSTK